MVGSKLKVGGTFLSPEQCDRQQVDLELVSWSASGHDPLPPPLSPVSLLLVALIQSLSAYSRADSWPLLDFGWGWTWPVAGR